MNDSSQIPVTPELFLMENLWTPSSGSAVPLRDSTSGSPPRNQTWIRCSYDDVSLRVLFSGEDDLVQATYRARDEPLYEEDVLEVFLAPAALTSYFEFEVNPIGTLFDAAVVSPHGVRNTMHVDTSWNCPGLQTFTRRTLQSPSSPALFDTLLMIPFDGLPVLPPHPGDRWRANFFRIDRHPEGDEYTAWQPTGKQPPDFHVPAAFGTLLFS